MSESLVPRGSARVRPSPVDWNDPDAGDALGSRHPLERLLASVRRNKLLMLGMVSLGIGAGILGLKFLRPQYEVQATIWIQSETPNDRNAVGPIRTQELLNSNAWVELLRSYRISDEVVRKLALYVIPENKEDASLFGTFALANRFAPGEYELEINADQKRWALKMAGGSVIESGTAQDSVGRKLGFRWAAPASLFARTGIHTVRFTVATPRETSIKLMEKLGTKLAPQTNFLRLTYQDEDPQLAARTLNTWADEYVTVAGELKKRNIREFSSILDGQLEFAQRSLVDAERALENFRVHTITLPAEGGPVAAGVEMTRDPALKSFFDQKIEYDNLRHDREAVEKVIQNARANNLPYEGMLLVPSVAQSPGADALRDAFKQQYQLQAELAAHRQIYTNEHPLVKELNGRLITLQNQTIPTLASQLLAQLRQRERDYEVRIAGASKEMQAVPPRTIEEMRLRRAVSVAEGLYTTLKSRAAEAKLAEASATADISVLDSAVAPLDPTRNTAPGIMAIAILAGIAAALGLAMLLDRLDGRIRYPEQATHDLGLPVAGVVPRLPKNGVDSSTSPEHVLQLVESFRSLRMHVIHSVQLPATLAVSSPAPGDGKSLVAANLAMSFAEAGYRTVLIDGDTRRGSLHTMFGAKSPRGFTEYLFGEVEVGDILLPTGHEKLWLLACGRRHKSSPEFLTSPRVVQLVTALRRAYDVIIFDTPPLAAGIDGYALSAAAGHLLMVLRVGQTNRKLTSAKLTIVDRLPINVIGTVLNGVELTGEFQYYGYASGYAVADTGGEVPATTGF